MKKTLINLAILSTALVAPTAFAHSTFVEHEIVEGQKTYLTAQIPHGCTADDGTKLMTNGIIINMPNSQEEIDAGWAFTSVSPSLSHIEQRVKTVSVQLANRDGVVEATDLVSEVAFLHLHLPSSWNFKAEIRGRAPMLPEGEESKELFFDVIQYCPEGKTVEWTVANGKALKVTVVKAEEAAAHH